MEWNQGLQRHGVGGDIALESAKHICQDDTNMTVTATDPDSVTSRNDIFHSKQNKALIN
jgi:hypothetical protein